VPADSSAGRAQAWTAPSDLRTLSLKAWSSGSLLRELLEPSGAYPRRRTLKGPTAAALLRDYAAGRGGIRFGTG